MQLPMLGTLFKSRDYINHQTELMVLVTPYIVRAVAQKDLSRPDDGFADATDPAADPARPVQPHLRRAGKTPIRAAQLPRQFRLHPGLSSGRRSMTAVPSTIAERRCRAALRLLAAGSLAAMLGGCYKSTVAQDASYPEDYRAAPSDHLAGRRHTVDVFIGRNRGGLTPAQRADVLAFAQTWKHEATSGIVIDVPAAARPTAPPPIRCAKSIRSSRPRACRAASCWRAAIRRRPARSPASSSSYTRLTAEAGPCGLWPDDLGPAGGERYIENKPYWNFGCATQRNLAAMVANPADLVQPRGEAPIYTAAPLGRDRQVPQGREPVRHLCRLRPGQDQRCRQMIKYRICKSQPPKSVRRRPTAPPTSTSRRRRAFRSRRFARRSRPPPPCRRPARTAGSPRRISRSRWAASPPPSKPTAARRRPTSSSSSRTAAATTSSPASTSWPRSATPARA